MDENMLVYRLRFGSDLLLLVEDHMFPIDDYFVLGCKVAHYRGLRGEGLDVVCFYCRWGRLWIDSLPNNFYCVALQFFLTAVFEKGNIHLGSRFAR
jgi:hypothetical protein